MLCSRPACPFEGCSLALAQAGLLHLLGCGDSHNRIITGTLLIAISVPKFRVIVFFDFRKNRGSPISKSEESL
jgi:hypothetical protein